MGIADSDLAGMRETVNEFSPTLCVITRTNQSVYGRISRGTGTIRMQGLPSFVRCPEWWFTSQDALDLKPGDTITATGLGLYEVVEEGNPTSISVSTTAKCVRVRTPGGALDFLTNATVTFDNPSDSADAIQESVFLYDASADLQLYPAVARYKLAVLYDATLRDESGAVVSANWEITWTQPNGVTQTETLSKPRYVYGPWPCAIAYFGTNN